MRNIYTDFYKDASRRKNLHTSPRVNKMIELLKPYVRRLDRMLDIGCYDGTFLSHFQECNRFGVDANVWAVSECKKKGIDARNLYLEPGVKLPFSNEYFDVVVAGEIIEHVFDTDYFLEEIRRVLKKNGLLLVSTPNIASLGRRIMLLFGISPIIETSPNEKESVGHIRYFTFHTLRRLLSKHSFMKIKSISDVINFEPSGNISNQCLARIFPTLGASCIVLAKKK